MFQGEFTIEKTPTGQVMEFVPDDVSVLYSLMITDAHVTYSVTGANPYLASKMHFVDLDTYCAFQSRSHAIA